MQSYLHIYHCIGCLWMCLNYRITEGAIIHTYASRLESRARTRHFISSINIYGNRHLRGELMDNRVVRGLLSPSVLFPVNSSINALHAFTSFSLRELRRVGGGGGKINCGVARKTRRVNLLSEPSRTRTARMIGNDGTNINDVWWMRYVRLRVNAILQRERLLTGMRDFVFCQRLDRYCLRFSVVKRKICHAKKRTQCRIIVKNLPAWLWINKQ